MEQYIKCGESPLKMEESIEEIGEGKLFTRVRFLFRMSGFMSEQTS